MIGVRNYRKKPVVIEAMQLDEDSHSFDEAQSWILNNAGDCSIDYDDDQGGYSLNVHTLEGNMVAQRGDWIIKGVAGEFYPCKPDIFDATYEPVA